MSEKKENPAGRADNEKGAKNKAKGNYVKTGKPPVEKQEKDAKSGNRQKKIAPEEEKEKTVKGQAKATSKAVKEKKSGKKTFAAKAISLTEKHVYLISALACIAIIAVAAAIILTPEEANVDDFHNNPAYNGEEYSQVKMIIVTSDRCPGCEQGNSMELLFAKNDINYAVNTFEESTADGQALIQATGAKKLPLYLIDEESLSDKMTVKTESGFAPLKEVLHFYVRTGEGMYEEGIFSFPEMNMDGVIRSNLLLQEACGNKNNYSIQYFADPYDPITILRSKDYTNFIQLLASEDVNATSIYQYLPTYTNILLQAYISKYGGKPETVKSNLEEPAKYLVCTNNIFGPEKFEEMQDAIYAKYCDISTDGADYNFAALQNCDKSSHYNNFITGEEMMQITKELGLEGDIALNACLSEVEESFTTAEQIAKIAGIKRTPTALVNCQYEVPINKIISAICQIDPGMKFC